MIECVLDFHYYRLVYLQFEMFLVSPADNIVKSNSCNKIFYREFFHSNHVTVILNH